MRNIILLDTSPLGLITHPKDNPESIECRRWLEAQLIKGIVVLVPGICDYELRRELIRLNSNKGLAKLDALKKSLGFVPITTEVMNQAAELWAKARSLGKPTSSDHALD